MGKTIKSKKINGKTYLYYHILGGKTQDLNMENILNIVKVTILGENTEECFSKNIFLRKI